MVALAELSPAGEDGTAESADTEATQTPRATIAAPPESTAISAPISTDAAISETDTPDSQMTAALRASATLTRSATTSSAVFRTPTVTPLPFHFAQLIPTPTEVGSIAGQELSECEIPRGWRPYEVRVGDTLLSLALATDSSLIELRDGNCFELIRGIFAGQRLFVPRLPAEHIIRPAPVYPPVDAAANATGCDQPIAQISAPKPLDNLKGIFAIRGSVQFPEGGGYQIALRPAWADNYFLYLSSNEAIGNDVIALINTEIFGAGLHQIRLTITGSHGETIEGGHCELPVVFGAP